MSEPVRMVDELKLYIKNRDFLALSRLLEEIDRGAVHDPLQRDLLLDEIEIQIEDLKGEATRMFDREEFASCLEIFEFLVKVNPADRPSKDYLEVCRQVFGQQSRPEASPVTFSVPTGEVEANRGNVSKVQVQEASELTRKMRTYFDLRDFDSLKAVVKGALGQDIKKPAGDTDRRLEDEELKAEFEAHVRNLKAEAIQQFQSGDLSRCLGTFRFLCELEPEDQELRRYLQGCLELILGSSSPGAKRGQDRASKLVDTEIRAHHVSGQSSIQQEHCSPPPDASDSARTNFESPEIELDDKNLLEIPNVYLPEAPGPGAPEKAPGAKTWMGRLAWLKLALPVGAVCLLIWLVIPRSSPQLSERGEGDSAVLGSDVELIRKAESAMAEHRYASPVNDNVIAYCDRILAADSSNAKALKLKKDSLGEATQQAEELVSKGRYDSAREVYQALLRLPKEDGLNQEDLGEKLKQVEFDSYPVVHKHFLGSCKGTLKVNTYVLSFVPCGGSKDGFTQRLSRIKIRLDDTLTVETNQKSYRFEAPSGKTDQDRKAATKELHEALSRRLGTV